MLVIEIHCVSESYFLHTLYKPICNVLEISSITHKESVNVYDLVVNMIVPLFLLLISYFFKYKINLSF